MIPVFIHNVNGTRGLAFSDFENLVIEICERHQAERRACAFAMLLHDAGSPHLGQVLSDPTYWAALDQISGNALTVFSIFSGALRRDDDFPQGEYSQDMQHVARLSNRVVERYFAVNRLRMPSVLFFQVSEGEVLGSRLVALQERRIEAAFEELSDLLTLVAGALTDSVGKRFRNPDEAFERLDRALTGRSVARASGSVFRFASTMQPLLNALFRWS